MKTALADGTITEERLDDAVAKILAVKLAFGLVNDQHTAEKPQQAEHMTTEYEDSLAAVHESLVLLKNDQILPMKKENLEYIVLVGERSVTVGDQERLYQSFNNIGMQCGGWSLRWQGFEGNGLWEGRNK
jgi:beta-glucosidase